MKKAYCARCKQEIHFYQKNPPKIVDCPRCGLTRLVVKEVKENIK